MFGLDGDSGFYGEMFAGILNPESWTANTGDVDYLDLKKYDGILNLVKINSTLGDGIFLVPLGGGYDEIDKFVKKISDAVGLIPNLAIALLMPEVGVAARIGVAAAPLVADIIVNQSLDKDKIKDGIKIGIDIIGEKGIDTKLLSSALMAFDVVEIFANDPKLGYTNYVYDMSDENKLKKINDEQLFIKYAADELKNFGYSVNIKSDGSFIRNVSVTGHAGFLFDDYDKFKSVKPIMENLRDNWNSKNHGREIRLFSDR
jgi:hypothetical protein